MDPRGHYRRVYSWYQLDLVPILHVACHTSRALALIIAATSNRDHYLSVSCHSKSVLVVFCHLKNVVISVLVRICYLINSHLPRDRLPRVQIKTLINTAIMLSYHLTVHDY